MLTSIDEFGKIPQTALTILVFLYYFVLEFLLLTGMVVAISAPRSGCSTNPTVLTPIDPPTGSTPLAHSSTMDSY